MRSFVQIGIIAFSVALAVVVGRQLSAEAMAVVVGVVCGVLASIPTSVLILAVSRRQQNRPARSSAPATPQAMPYPPVVIIQSDGRPAHQPPSLPWEAGPPGTESQPWKRSFTVVGEEEDW